MGKKVLTFIAQVLSTTVVFTFVLWLFNAAFDRNFAFSYEMLIQGLVFSILFVPFSRWRKAKAKKS